MRNLGNKNKSIQNKDYEELDDNPHDIKKPGQHDMEEGNDKQEKLIGKQQARKKRESVSSEKTKAEPRQSVMISDQPPDAEERMHWLRQILRKVSVGKYYTKMYFNGKDSQSSSIGGILTLLSGAAIIVWMVFTIIGVVNREKYFIDESMKEIHKFNIANPLYLPCENC